jgi:hypothetical protein
MHYHLSFLDDDGRVLDVCEAEIATEGIAIQWMRLVGAEWARHYDWCLMELWCQEHCVARVPVGIHEAQARIAASCGEQ